MSGRRIRSNRWIGVSALAASVLAGTMVWPVLAQESLLPPGFDQPPARPAPAPSPSPAPGATEPQRPPTSPSPRPADRPADRPSTTPHTPRSPDGVRPAVPGPGGPVAPGFDALSGEDGLSALPPPPPRYDMPPGSRRSLSRVGPLSPETGGLAAGAFGNRGQYVTALMTGVRQPVVSRWSHILLRRALLSAVDTPANVNGADFAADRAALLLRQGESVAARMLVQSVDVDKASAKLRATALQVYLANADPAGLCPHAPAMAGPDKTWQLVRAMCASLNGESGTAGAGIERARRDGTLAAIDVKLAEKVVGAGVNSSRSARIEWNGVNRLTPWRLGLATATGVDVPERLWTATPDVALRRWAVQMPMIDIQQRMAFAAEAAGAGVLSSRAYVDLVSLAAAQEEPVANLGDLVANVRGSFVFAELPDRLAAIAALIQTGDYAGKVLTARAAARIGPLALSDAEQWMLLSAMFAGGLDNNAIAWTPRVTVGSQAWGLLAVGLPRPLQAVSAGNVGDFADGDDSTDGLRTRFLAAALIGLDRVSADDASTLSSRHDLRLSTSTRWTRAITVAADRGEAGTVALLVAVGLQGRSWQDVPPYHLYHITAALRRVGLGAEARMIAAEALTRA